MRELIRLGGNVDFRYPEDRARVIRIFLVLQIISIRQLDLEIHKENCTSAILISCREVLMKSKVYSGRCWRHGDYKDPEYKGIKRKKSGITSGNALRYIQNPDKTEECVLVGSINCLPDTAFEQW